ncbi:hypothetical protein SynA1825c_00816 [Synechococcus sp. A18-25c]|nr:hypothetical protein SynA1560_00845 [Synechococcus sp. A15-60]QNJ19133.1 hypothetical protein SynA1825c_00816 [Synechococcus sp. A18-25c]
MAIDRENLMRLLCDVHQLPSQFTMTVDGTFDHCSFRP